MGTNTVIYEDAAGKETKLALVNLKSVILYDKRRMQPDTLKAILEAEDGAMIAVDPSELDAFTALTFYIPDVKLAHKKLTTHTQDKPDKEE